MCGEGSEREPARWRRWILEEEGERGWEPLEIEEVGEGKVRDWDARVEAWEVGDLMWRMSKASSIICKRKMRKVPLFLI